MDDRRFDDLARRLAGARISRRQGLRAALSGVAGVALSGPLATLAARPAAAATRQVCDKQAMAACLDVHTKALRIDLAACAFSPRAEKEICVGAAKRTFSRAQARCRVEHCACPPRTTRCGTPGPGGLCCEPDETCELLFPLLGDFSPVRCRKRCDPPCSPPFDTCCPTSPGSDDHVCVNTTDNDRHCGACNHPCAAGQVCRDGACRCPDGRDACAGTCCPAGQVCCGGACVDTAHDARHCGACGRSCPPGQACVDGTCQACHPACGEGQACCDGTCVDIRANRDHCGGCGQVCPAGERCVDGRCTGQCPEGFRLCNGVCVDVRTDAKNCGLCGNDCTAMSWSCGVCTNGTCECLGNGPGGCGPCGG